MMKKFADLFFKLFAWIIVMGSLTVIGLLIIASVAASIKLLLRILS